MTLRVIVSGGGIGGLCLAQGLRKSGVRVDIYERDTASDSRSQGYRLRMDADGDQALRTCLPDDLFALYRATASRPNRNPDTVYDHCLNAIYRLDGGAAAAAPGSGAAPPVHASVNRLTLRQVLLGRLDDAVHFGLAVTAFDQDETGVRVRLDDGSTVAADVLVAADGVHSGIREALLPDAHVIDTGMRGIYGKTPLDADTLAWLPEPLQRGFVPVLGPDRCTLALGMFQAARRPVEAAADLAPGVRLDEVPDYLMWILVCPREACPLCDTAAWTPVMSLHLHQSAQSMLCDWHPDLRRIIDNAWAAATFPVAIRTSQCLPAWPASRVTLLGDAIHAMTPAGGVGANTALRDAALLAHHLAAANRDALDPTTAIAEYEAAMRDYGFAAVDRSLRNAANLYRVAIPMEVSPR